MINRGSLRYAIILVLGEGRFSALARFLSLLVLILLAAGCSVGGEKNLFQMVRVNPAEVVRITVTHGGKTVVVEDPEMLARLEDKIGRSAPAGAVPGSRIGSGTGADYTIEIFAGAGGTPVRFAYDSEKQMIYYTSGKKKFPPFKNEALAEDLSGLFSINVYRAVMVEKQGLPDYIDLQGCYDGKRLYGMRGEQFVVWDVENNAAEVLINGAWSARLSPDRTKVAYNNRQGISILDLKTLSSVIAVRPDRGDSGGLTPAPAVWSPDSRQLLYSVDHEWNSDYFIYDLASGTSRPFLFKNVENFLSKPAAWLKNGEILFTVSFSRSRDGKKEYTSSGYRSDLMAAGGDGVFRRLTDMDDFHYVEFAGLTENEDLALIITRDRNNAGRRAALVNLADGTTVELPGDAPVVSAGISPDGRFVVQTFPGADRRGYRLTVRDRETGAGIARFENREYTPDKFFIWHPGGKKFYFQDKNPENNPPAKLQKILIIPG
ncbi:MAG: hypothetical protein K6T29_05995 [Peptococcaceae bacterium]|nr:hypothetical protein [Peptococcaceae bacterium]